LAVLEAAPAADLLRKIARRAAILVYGSDESAVREMASSLVKAVAGSLDDPFAVTRLDDAQLAKNKGLLADEAAALPLMGARRVVWVTGAGQGFFAAVQPLLETPGESNLIVAEAGVLAKSAALRTLFEKSDRAAIVPLYEDDPARVRRVIVEELRGANLIAADGAIERVMEVTGPARAQLRQELAKLVLYCAGKREVTIEDVEAVCGEASEPSADDVCDAAFGGRLDETDMHVRRLLASGLAGSRLLTMLLAHAARLRDMRAAVAAGKPASLVMKSTRPPIFFRRQAAISQQLNMWDFPALDSAASSLLAAIVQTRELRELEDDIAARSILSIARAAGRA
jgi:DNA polymerase III subunit delta